MIVVQPKASSEQLSQWWAGFQKTRSDDTRNHILENYLPLVKYTAQRLHAKLPPEAELDDLISSGIFGLLDAINSYDPQRHVKFETYAPPRIRGAILDELREMDWIPRLVRVRTRRANEARREYHSVKGREPDDGELAKQMGLSPKEFEKIYRDSKPAGIVSLDKKWFETDSHKDVREIDVLEDKHAQSPYTDAQRRDIKELVTRGISRAERLIIILYYFEKMTMKEIGATIGVCESRISQMHSSILERLNKKLIEKQEELFGTRPAPAETPKAVGKKRALTEWQIKYRRLRSDFPVSNGRLLTLEQLQDYYGYPMRNTRTLAAKISSRDETRTGRIRLGLVLGYFRHMAGS